MTIYEVPVPVFQMHLPALEKSVVVEKNDHVLETSVLVEESTCPCL